MQMRLCQDIGEEEEEKMEIETKEDATIVEEERAS